MPVEPPNGRKVKSGQADAVATTDQHERAKDYLSPAEMARLLDTARPAGTGCADYLLLLLTYRHGLRVSEAVGLRRDALDLDRARLWVRRLKGGLSVEQPIAGDELRAIRRYLATRSSALPWLFVSERGQPMTRQAVNYLVTAAAARAGLANVHPHTLRHSYGFALADKGHDLRLIQDHVGHRDPRHTVHYTRTMCLLRTATGKFIDTSAIVQLQRDDNGAGWRAVLADGAKILLEPYYSAPGRIEQDFSHLVQCSAAAPATSVCRTEACCAQ